MGLDGDFELRHIHVDSAVLAFFVGVDCPVGLAGDAETGVVEDKDELAAGLEMAGGVLEKDLEVLYILDGE